MEYDLKAERVIQTIRARLQKGDFGSTESSSALIGTRARPLFDLRLSEEGSVWVLEGVGGKYERDENSLQGIEPDPLWDSAAGICSHMEADHADTFRSFLAFVGRENSEFDSVGMPWVEESGFFLSLHSSSKIEYVWIPFPEPCPTSGHVRKTLIKMLKEMRVQS